MVIAACGGGLCSCVLISVIILCSSARHRSEPVAVTLINSRGERSTESITTHPAVYSPAFSGTFLISANIKLETQRRYLQKRNSLTVHFNGKQDKWEHVQTGGVFFFMKCVFACALQSDSNQSVSNSSWKFICSLLQVMILTSNLASPPVILRNKPAQRFKWLPFSILEHIWHMTQAFHSRLKAPRPHYIFLSEKQSDCAAIVASPLLLLLLLPSLLFFPPQGPVQFQAALAEKCPHRPKWNHSFSSGLWSRERLGSARKRQKEIRKTDRKKKRNKSLRCPSPLLVLPKTTTPSLPKDLQAMLWVSNNQNIHKRGAAAISFH